MPDARDGQRHGWSGLKRPRQTGRAGAPVSLVMAGLIGEPPWPGSGASVHGWIARLRAAVQEPLSEGREAPRRSFRGLARFWRDGAIERAGFRNYAIAILFVAAAAVLGLIVQPFLATGSIVLLFLISVLLTAIGQGLGPSLAASVLSVLAYDFLFLPPLYSLNVDNPDDVIRMASFALAAIIVSNLAAHARRHAVLASQRALVAEELYRFGRQLTGVANLPEMLAESIPRLQAILGGHVAILLPDGDEVAVHQEARTGDAILGGTEFAYVKTCVKAWLRRESADVPDLDAPESSPWRFVPMRTGRGKVGVMAIARDTNDVIPLPHSEALFGTLADLMAQAIDRINLVETLNEASRAVEREKLHAALMASLSHDLRTPLAAVLCSAESLIAPDGEAPDAATRDTLARSIQDEARRLNRYIGNLLDMTRLESGLADASRGRIDLADVVSVALERCADSLAGRDVAVTFEADLPMLAGDEVLLEHVLFNLLDNAAKYTPAGSGIQLRAFRDDGQLTVQVVDEGPGLRSADLGRIFDKFYRAEQDRGRRPGIGLGLAICRGYVEAMGGHIMAGNRDDRHGAVFTITLPIPAAEDLPDLSA